MHGFTTMPHTATRAIKKLRRRLAGAAYSPACRGLHCISWRNWGLPAIVVASTLLWGLAGVLRAEDAPTPEQLEFFEKRIRPVLVEHCHKCHGPKVQKGGLRLDSRPALLAGGDSGPAVVPGRPDEGYLVRAVEYGDVFQMPPTGKLPDSIAADLRHWVEMGAPWPEEAPPAVPGEQSAKDDAIGRQHWCFLPITEVAPPAVQNEAWVRSPIDRFILARLEAAGLQPAPEADRRTWLRRVTFALVGLPPTAGELHAFLDDASPEAYGRVVDRLLASPQFGERWARHWLDLVRYAESRGHEFDFTIPNAWQYRDYVIRALNADVPYDQFVMEHVAGDLLPQPRVHPELGFNESVLGTGFWFLGEEVHSPVDIRADEMDRTDNKLDCFSKTFLALTVGCARCHDHKFDPIATREYYALAGHVASAGYRQTAFEANLHNERVVQDLAALYAERGLALRTSLLEALQPTLSRLEPLLLAAAEVVRKGAGDLPGATQHGTPSGEQQGGLTDETDAHAAEAAAARVAKVAADSNLPQELLAAWVSELKGAARDAGHPLHLFALAVASADDAGRVDALDAGSQTRDAAGDFELPPGARIVIDYRHGTPAEWYQEGVAFGWGAREAGDIEVLLERGEPRLRVVSLGAAEAQPALGRLELKPGTEREPSRVHWQQAGRTLKTPTLTLKTGRLFYLVRGGGFALAAVCGHRMLQGPLHGALTLEWQAADGWRWIEHNLTGYVGQRVAVEFSPRPAADDPGGIEPLAIALVIESDQPPSMPATASLLLDPGEVEQAVTLSALAREFQLFFARALSAEPHAADVQARRPRLLAWLADRPVLWRALAGEAGGRLSALVSETATRQAEILGRLSTVSATAPALFEGSGVEEFLLVRGNPRTPSDPCPRGYLQVLESDATRAAQPLNRLELAQKLADPSNPLTSRVIVNRVWHHLFGRGLVASVDNFGTLGEPPTHPELLDWLAVRFIEQGWSIKRLIRELVLSSAYRMASAPAQAADPQNLLWHRMPLRRLEAEAIRDSLLAVSGRLDSTLGGPSVPVYLTPFMSGRGRPEQSGPLDGNGRRSIYLAVRRNFLNPLLLAFDAPAPMSTVGRRNVSNVPAQALALLNNAFVVEQARLWAEQALAEGAPETELVTRLYETALARAPDPDELTAALDFVHTQAAAYGDATGLRAWADLCHVIFNAKEFVFVE